MSERRSLLRAAVNERLAAAAEEIFVLLERTIAEYEEEVCRSKEENQRNQQLLEALRPRVLLHRTEDTESHGELRLKTEPEHLSITPESHHRPAVTAALCVKVKETEELVRDATPTEEWTEPLEAPPEAQDQDGFGFTEEETGLGPKRRKCLVNQIHVSQRAAKEQRTARGECAVCGKVFSDLWRHTLMHTGERPYSCSVCRKGFTRKSSLTLHCALHMKEKPFTCQVCGRGFTQSNNLKVHLKVHLKGHLKVHLKGHLKVHLKGHLGTLTPEPPGGRLHLQPHFHTPNSVCTSQAPLIQDGVLFK